MHRAEAPANKIVISVLNGINRKCIRQKPRQTNLWYPYWMVSIGNAPGKNLGMLYPARKVSGTPFGINLNYHSIVFWKRKRHNLVFLLLFAILLLFFCIFCQNLVKCNHKGVIRYGLEPICLSALAGINRRCWEQSLAIYSDPGEVDHRGGESGIKIKRCGKEGITKVVNGPLRSTPAPAK